MARDLKKFVNPRFMKTVDLRLLRRLFERQPPDGRGGFDVGVFDQDDQTAVREAIQDFLMGPENTLPQGLVADLHRIAELGSENGMRILMEQAARRDVVLAAPVDDHGHPVRLEPKQVALVAFLDHEAVFNAASDLLALEARDSLTEFAGADEGIEPRLDETVQRRFEQAAREMFIRDLQGGYCRVGWYPDEDEINVVVTHGTAVTVTTVIEGEQERVISFQAAGHAVLAYVPLTGRLKVGGLARARRANLAAIFAEVLLDRPDFFAGADSQNLYTLEPIERRGFGFTLDHAFDRGIEWARIVEAQVDRVTTGDDGDVRVLWSLVARDARDNALARFADMTRGVTFGPDGFRLGHVVVRVQFRPERGHPAKVTIKIKPPDSARFKRQSYEGRIMELLHRNGLCREREFADPS